MFKLLVFGCLFMASSGEAFQKIRVENYGQIKANISFDEMNRISVDGDRITQVFGSEDKFETELDEVNGQIFIKPLTIDKTPLSLTIVTEGGITQDLILTPSKGSSEVILLQSKDSFTNKESIETNFYFKSLPIQQKVLKLLKQLAGEGCVRGYVKEENFDRFRYERTPRSSNLKIRPLTVFKGREFTGIVADLISTSCLHYLAHPKEIYETGDLAISFTQQILKPNVPVRIYILQKTGRGS